MGPLSSVLPGRDPEARDELLPSADVSLLEGLGDSATVGFGGGATSTFVSPGIVDREPIRAFGPSAARAPAARICSSVNVARAGFFSRDLGLRGVDGVGVVNSEVGSSDGCGVCLAGSVFFS